MTTTAATSTPGHDRQPQIGQTEADPDELGDDGQRVEQEQVDHRECAPEPAETFQDQPGVPDPGDRAQPHDHLLVDIQHRDQQQQGPQQGGAVVLPGLGVGGERAGVVVADHHDQPRADDRDQRLQLRREPPPRAGVLRGDGAQRAADVPDMGLVEHRALGPPRGALLAVWR